MTDTRTAPDLDRGHNGKVGPQDLPPAPTEPPQRPGPGWGRILRAVLIGAYVGALWASIQVWGVPLRRTLVICWVMAGLVILSVGRPQGGLWRVIRDWLPFGAVLVVYDLSRGAADGLGTNVHYRPQVTVDNWIGLGNNPTVWLQRHCYDLFRVQWWEVALSLLYVSHFVVPFAVAAWLWLKDRPRWGQYVRRFVTLSFMGALTFMAFPAAPPWMAGYENYIPRVIRTSLRGWSYLGLHGAEDFLELGQRTVNTVAAIPSLHGAYAVLVAWVLWPRVNWLVRTLMVLYSLSMGFMLVITGEHFVVDILVGWIYVAIAVLIWNRIERWWEGRRTPDDSNSTGELAESAG